MNLLAIDTCFAACSVALGQRLGSDAASTTRLFERLETGHGERLMPMIRAAMSAARINFKDIDKIAVTNGPGSFTGTRIGVAAARGLALAAGLPLVGASSLAVMACSPLIDTGAIAATGDLAITVDARRHQVYAQLFQAGGAAAKSKPMLLSIDEAAALGGAGAIIFAGSGAEAVARSAAKLGRAASVQCPGLQPDIGDFITAAARATPAAEPLAPLYLRPPGAKAQTGKSIERAT